MYAIRSYYVIGNAPTALFELLQLAAAGKVRPALVVGVPVGFVGAEESKEALYASGLPFITCRGRKGGSAIAAGLKVNAPKADDPVDVLAKVGGYEIGGIAGLVLGCAAAGIPVVVDGFISTA